MRFIGCARAHPKDVEYICAILFHWREAVEANIVSVNMVCGSRLYRNIRSLVGKRRESVRLRHVLTPRCVVMTTVRCARSGEIIHRAAKVCGSIGAILRDRICPLRLVLTLEIMTFEFKTWWKFSTSTRSELKDESELMAKMPTCPLTAAQRTTLPE